MVDQSENSEAWRIYFCRTREMAQPIKSTGLSSRGPGFLSQHLPIVGNSGSQDPVLFLLPRVLHYMWCTYIHACRQNTHIHKMKNKFKKIIYFQSHKKWVKLPVLFDPTSIAIKSCYILRLQRHERRQVQQSFLARYGPVTPEKETSSAGFNRKVVPDDWATGIIREHWEGIFLGARKNIREEQ